MEPAVVHNYAKCIADFGIPHLLIRNKRYGKPVKGQSRYYVDEPMGIDNIVSCFPDYEELERDAAAFGDGWSQVAVVMARK